MTHLLIDAVGARGGGGATVALAALHAALAHPDVSRVTLAALPAPARGFTVPTHPKLGLIEPPALAYPARLLWHTIGLWTAARAVGASRVLDLNALGHTPGVPRAALLQQHLVLTAAPPATLAPAHRRRLRLIRALTALSAARADLLITQRPGVARLVRGWLGREALVATPHATWHEHDVSAPNPALDRMASDPAARLLVIGSELSTKRLDLVLAALRHVRRERAATLYCTLPARHPLIAAERGVVGLGALSRPQVREALALARCLVVASEVETACLPLVEAMEVGCPIIAPDVEYVAEITGEAAARYRAGDVTALATTIQTALDDPALIARHSARGAARHEALVEARPYEAMIEAALRAGRAR